MGPSMNDQVGPPRRSWRSLSKARVCSQKRRISRSWLEKSGLGGTGLNIRPRLLLIFYNQLDALIALALTLVIHNPDAADLAGVGHVRAAIGLQVEADDLDRAHLGDSGR